jgi:hypothetical protein
MVFGRVAWIGGVVNPHALLDFLARLFLTGLGFIAFRVAVIIACCWCWIADTIVLVHQPAAVLAQVSIKLRGVPRMCPSGRGDARSTAMARC